MYTDYSIIPRYIRSMLTDFDMEFSEFFNFHSHIFPSLIFKTDIGYVESFAFCGLSFCHKHMGSLYPEESIVCAP